MSTLLETLYPAGLTAITSLFGEERVRECLPRLDAIYAHSETCWQDYARKIPQRMVSYVLIAEAPPWSPVGRPLYVLDPSSKPRTLLTALRRAFCLPSYGVDSSSTLDRLAEHGFLLLDSIPFAMDYQSKRGRTAYQTLVTSTFTSYLEAKITASGLAWSQELRIAFSLRANAAAIQGAGLELNTGSRRYALTPAMIAVNRANNPDGVRLRELFGLASIDTG